MSRVKFRRWKNYAGPAVIGTTSFKLPKNHTHWDRVVWLTSQVESGGKFGAIAMYDGTGVTAGVIQGIAVYPRELAHEDNNPADDQGPLWRMIEKIKETTPELTEKLDSELEECGWHIDRGRVRYLSGGIVNGNRLREELTPRNGKVPKHGQEWQEAKNWALIFHNIFSDPRSFRAQIDFGVEHMKRVAKRKPQVLRGKSVEEIIYEGNVDNGDSWTPDIRLDLAMAVFFSNSVNAPAMAFRKLHQALSNSPVTSYYRGVPLAKGPKASRIINALGTADYARWNFRLVSGRYQRTRKAAMKVWPKDYFTGEYSIMPRNF